MKCAYLFLPAMLLAACSQYPTNYGQAKVMGNVQDSQTPISTTYVSPLPWSAKEQWLEQYIMDVQFDVGSDTIAEMDKIHLTELAEKLDKLWNPMIYVQSHADTTGNPVFNHNLAERRGYAMRKVLIDAGVPKYRISVQSFGDRMPVTTNLTSEGRKKNRRSVAIVVPGTR